MKIALRSLSLFPAKDRGKMSEHIKAVIVLSVLALTASLAPVFKLEAQSDFKIGADHRVSLGGYDNTAIQTSTQITVSVKDSSLMWVIEEISRQARLKPVFNGGVQALSKKVSIDINNTEALTAIQRLLRNTGLVARLASDGETLMVRQMSDSGKDTLEGKGAITGRVLDSATGKGVEGVTVSVQGSSLSAITDGDGRFVLRTVPVGQRVLTFRLLGYTSRFETVAVKAAETKLEVKISSTATALNEVVTTATGSQRRVEIANDIVKINADEIRERAPVRNIAEMLEAAQVPGVLVERGSGDPGAPTRIRMRGIKSISQSNDPVMIVDGVWVDAKVRSPSPMDNIHPSNIETIEIIRGPSAATLYGQDASNGVIVITTKKGQVGPTRWSFGYNRDWGQPYGKKPVVYAGFGYNSITGVRRPCNIDNIIAFECIQDSVAIYDPNHPLLGKEGTETNHGYTMRVDGGTDAIRYNLNATNRNTIGVRRVAPIDMIRYRILGYNLPDDFKRPSSLGVQTLTSTLTLMPRRDLTLGVMVTGSQSELKDNNASATFSVIDMGAADRNYSLDTGSLFSNKNGIILGDRSTRKTQALLSGSALWNPGKFTINGNVGVERVVESRSSIGARTECNFGNPCVGTPAERDESSAQYGSYTVRLNTSTVLNMGRFNRIIEIRPTIGGDWVKRPNENFSIRKINIPAGEQSLSAGDFAGSDYTRSDNALAGWFINSTIGVLGRIYFDVGVRQDIGSAVSLSNSSDIRYPKLGGSWLVSDESFWLSNSFIPVFRVRGALGYAAVQPDVGDIRGRYVSGYRFINGGFVRSVSLNSAGNPALNPERALEAEFGFDMDLFDSRMEIVASYAHSENRNALVQRTLPPSAAGGPRKENIARVRNRSLELNTTAQVIEARTARVRVNYTLTLTENLVKELGDGVLPFSTGASGQIAEGYPIAGIWSRRVTGYRDYNDDGLLSLNEVILSDSAVYLGWSQPRVRAGYGVTVTMFNNLSFDTRLAYQSQYVKDYTVEGGYGQEDKTAPLKDQAVARVRGLAGKRPVSDLRWNSLSVSYRVPPKLLNGVKARELGVAFQASNLALWTNYAGRDPAVNNRVVASEVSADYGDVIPTPRRFTLSLNIGF